MQTQTTQPSFFATLRDALAGLFGYPTPTMEGVLTRRLEERS